MRALALVVLLAASTEARAQGGVPVSIDGALVAGAGVVGLLSASSVLFLTGVSTSHAIRGTRSAALIPALILGAAATIGGVALMGLAATGYRQHALLGASAGLTVFGLFNVAMPIVAWIRASERERVQPNRVEPVFIGGRTANGTGRRWSGIALQVAL